MFHPIYFIEPVILVSGISTVWEYTDGFAKQYWWSVNLYLMTVLSSSYGIIMDYEINAPGHRKFC